MTARVIAESPPATGDTARSPRSRFFRACAVGGAAAMVVFAWFALDGRADLFAREFVSNFYEIQARGLLHGHWDVPAAALSFERFNVGGKYYTYFGPFPALLRMPFVLFTHDLDGRLNKVSMIVAFAVLLVYVSRLGWQTRCLVRGEGQPARAALIAAGALVFVAGCGSSALFLAGWTSVYHEAILWGVALSVASYSYLVAYLREPSRRDLVLASLTATFAYLSRGTVGLGPVAALGIVLAARVAVRIRDAWDRRKAAEAGEARPAPWLRWLGLRTDAGNRSLVQLVVAAAVPVVLYAYVNYAKFGSLFGLPPYQKQDLLAARAIRQQALAANQGSLFGIKYAPTIVLQYLRPDALGFDPLFPWFHFSRPPRVIGSVIFESTGFSTSVTATSTLLVILTFLGVLAVVRAPRPEGGGPSAALLRVPVIGAAIGCIGAFLLAFIEQRYQGDFVPLFVLAGFTGMWWLPRLLANKARATRRVVAAFAVLLAAWSCWTIGSLTLLYQREYGPFVTTETRARLVDFQLRVQDLFPGGAPSRVVHIAHLPLPTPAAAGSLLVVGKCAGLYWSNGSAWDPIEATPETGHFHFRVALAQQPAGSLEPLLSATDGRGSSILWVRRLSGHRFRLEYEWTGKPKQPRFTTPVLDAPPGAFVELDVQLDPVVGVFQVRHAGKRLVTQFAVVARATAEIGRQAVSDRGGTRLHGTVRSLTTPTPACDRLARLERGG